MSDNGFNLEDVRDTFKEDMSGLLNRVDMTCEPLAAKELLEPITALVDKHGFGPAIDSFHGILGTASLLSIESLSQTAGALETLAQMGEAALIEARDGMKRAIRIAELCRVGAREMRSLLELELEGRTDDAQWVALDFRERIEEMRRAKKETVKRASESMRPSAMPREDAAAKATGDAAEFFGDDEVLLEESRNGTSGESTGEPAIDPELLEVFREEALTLLPEIQQSFKALAAKPTDVERLGHLERQFHTIRGAAGSVGLMEAAAIGEDVRARLEVLVDAGSGADKEFVASIHRDANRMCIAANLPELTAIFAEGEVPGHKSVLPPRPPSKQVQATPGDDLKAVFRSEAEHARRQLLAHFGGLLLMPSNKAAATALDGIFVTLRSAAASVGVESITAHVTMLQKVAEDLANLESPSSDAVRALLTKTNDFLSSLDVAPLSESELSRSGRDDATSSFSFWDEAPSSPDHPVLPDTDSHPVDVDVDPELVAIFRSEASEGLMALRGHMQALQNQLDQARIVHVERILHTLKGAAATVGLEHVSELASTLQQKCERVLEGEAELDKDLVEALEEGVRKLVAGAGLTVERAPDGASGGSVDENQSMSGDESPAAPAPAFFLDEARAACKSADELVESLKTAAVERKPELLRELRAIAHRLKGSALVVRANDVANEAARLQTVCEQDISIVDMREVQALLGRIAAIVGGAPKPKKAPRAPKEGAIRVEVPATDGELWESFLQECAELLDALDRNIFTLEDSEQPKHVLTDLFRTIHTLKGALTTIGLAPTGAELHEVEDFIERLLEATVLPPLAEVTNLLLEAQKSVRRALKQAPSGSVETIIEDIQARIHSLLRSRGPIVIDSSLGGDTGASISRDSQDSRDSRDSRDSGDSLESVGGSQGSVGSMGSKGSRGSKGSKDSGDEFASEERRFIRVSTDRLDSLMNLAGELVASRSRLMTRVSMLRGLQEELSRSRSRLVHTVETFREEHEFANIGTGAAMMKVSTTTTTTQRTVTMTADGGTVVSNGSGADGVTFGALELDEYEDVNILARILAEIGSDFNDVHREMSRQLGSFTDDSEAFGSIVSGIQAEVTRARMVPLDILFTRLRLPVREAAGREKKEVRVNTYGADVNLDKTIVDSLFGPMLHLVRNAVAHGIEAPQVRAAHRKDRTGTLSLGARQESGQIVIEIEDDGGGLNLEALRAKGIAMGLVSSDVAVDDPVVKDLVFASGLSTHKTADAISGRGMGGDVARRVIERLNGDIRVETVKGKGTKFFITLPLTLAITRALIIKVGSRSYAIPLYFAEHIIDAEQAMIVEAAGVRRVKVNDAFMPLRTMTEIFREHEVTNPRGPVLLLRVGDQRAAIQVDAVIGQEEIVVKSLGDLLAGHPFFAGAMVRGAGELLLIVDVPGIMGSEGRARTGKAPTVQRELPGANDDAVGPALPAPTDGSIDSNDPVVQAIAPAPQKSRLRVLFVDDSLSVRKVAEQMLEAAGIDVTVAVDGVDGLAKLRNSSFDLVFTDLEMPRMHGFDFIREIRFLPAFKHLPVVVVSSRSGQKHREQGKAAGATEYLTKPFSAQTLLGALKRLVHGKTE